MCFIITPNELLSHVEFNLRIAALPLRDGDEEHVCQRMHSFLPPPSARWSDPSKRLTASEQIERRRNHSDGSDSLFHFHAAADSICTDVQRIRWCMPLLSRSQLNELISAVALVCLPLRSRPRWHGGGGVPHRPPLSAPSRHYFMEMAPFLFIEL